ncbi:MAG: peroxiredoxin [Chromatiales bacterium]|nr:peroxiredoxin [Chromatiales bacterium]
MLEVNQMAPGFAAATAAGRTISLDDFRGRKSVVLYFYPKDDTPGCTIEANQFTALADAFAAADSIVIGVSRDSCESHQAFIDKFGLKVELLADTDGRICEAYGVWQEKEKQGVKKMGIVRSTFIIDRMGHLACVEYGVDPEGHAQKILERVRTI